MKSKLFLFLFIIIHVKSNAQKGLPSAIPTSALVATHYPQHVDYKAGMESQLKVPQGFTVSVAAAGLGKPRMMCVNDNGGLYVTRRDVGDVLLLTDTNNDGKMDKLQTVWSHFNDVHGIVIHEGWLYLCSSKELKKGRLESDGTVSDTTTIFNDLPDGGQHDNRTLEFGPDGLLYITVGSDCNDCKETNPEHATLLQVSKDETKRTVFARGLRNTIGFDFNPQTKEIWGFDNGTDWRGDSIPPEELNHIVFNGDYGWPLVYGKQMVDNTREDPMGTTKQAYAATTIPAVLTFPAHSAPIDAKFLDKAKSFPAAYQSDILVCWHGSWNRSQPDGCKIQRIIFKNGEPASSEDFLSGFLSADGNSRFGRPAGLAFSKNGNLFVSDDENGIIYLVSYKKS